MPMYDSTNAWDIPGDAEAVAGYDDGDYAWTADRWQAWSHVPCLHITTRAPGDPNSDCADCENGDLTEAQAAEWAAERISRHLPAVIYSSVSRLDALQAELRTRGHGFGEHTWPDAGAYWWPADWPANPDQPGTPHLYPAPGVVATQYASPPGSGGHYDLSSTIAGFPATTTSPPPDPQPTQGSDDDMIEALRKSDGETFTFSGSHKHGIPDEEIEGVYFGRLNVTEQKDPDPAKQAHWDAYVDSIPNA